MIIVSQPHHHKNYLSFFFTSINITSPIYFLSQFYAFFFVLEVSSSPSSSSPSIMTQTDARTYITIKDNKNHHSLMLYRLLHHRFLRYCTGSHYHHRHHHYHHYTGSCSSSPSPRRYHELSCYHHYHLSPFTISPSPRDFEPSLSSKT